jgi:aspartyl-tRNA synthetase
MERLKRTHTCGQLTKSDAGAEVVLNGWVHRLRDHGGIKFIDLRDRYGVTQVLIDPAERPELAGTAADLKFEYCVAVLGVVRARPPAMVNSEMVTGEIEVAASELLVLSRSEVLPFMIDERTDAREELRFRYRYLDLRSGAMQRKLRLRHEVTLAVREYLADEGFYEIETPTLIRSTPEGARDFLVPSRLHAGTFYALPQSPQLYKQILMVSGFDRYFQIAHCFRDEDSRGDRQPEHTQIDLEMSFVSREDIFSVMEGTIAHVFRKALGVDLPLPFPRLSYHEAMNHYGTDRPDLRFAMELRDFAPWVPAGDFNVFKQVLEDGGTVKALVAGGYADRSRKQIEELEALAKRYGARGLAWMKVAADGSLEGGVGRFYAAQSSAICSGLDAAPGDLVLLCGADWKTACTALGAVRSRLGQEAGASGDKRFQFCWVLDFPLFEWNEEEERWEAAHHMFTMPQERFLDSLEEKPGEVLGDLYDLVCDGVELASGSIRIHDPELQRRIFRVVGFSEEEAERRFGFLLEAFRYGAPPHGGIAPGLDRLVMLMAGESSIREVIAFPKNTVAASPMDGAPARVDESQLTDLGLALLPQADPAGGG